MKRTIKSGLLFASLMLTVLATYAQTKPATAKPAAAKQLRYKDVVVDNPNAEADMKVVGDYVNSVVSGDLDKVKTLLAENYKGHGPSPIDSTTAEQAITNWKENYKTQSDRKVSFVTQTFKVLQGNLKGNWVSLWGDYSFTQDGKNVSFPFQYTARVTAGKIDEDRIYYDRMYILQTLGFKVTPPEAK
jgi:ketosteroid isomerase-like protein